MKLIFKMILNVFLWTAPLLSYGAAPEKLQVSVLKSPIPVKTSHGEVLVYELNLLNTADRPVRIGRIEVWDHRHLLRSYAGVQLINNSFMYGKEAKGRRFVIQFHSGAESMEGSNKGFIFKFQKKKHNQYVKKGGGTFVELKKGMGAIVYLWVPVEKGQQVPEQLNHKIWQGFPGPEKNHFTTRILDYSVPVSKQKPVVLGNPLRGMNWIASGALSPDSYHRRSVIPQDGKFYLSQRYAIDWVQMCPNGREEQGGLRNNQHWNAFGHELLAAVDGVVTQVHDGVKENTPPGLPQRLPSLEDVSGNRVVLKFHQNKRDYYMLYAHMQPGSIRVKKGDTVKEGQVLGLLGNTGNSAQPHLHMQVMDVDNDLKSEGIPFVFKNAVYSGEAQEIDMDYGQWKPFRPNPSAFKGIVPTENQVFEFSDEKPGQCDEVTFKQRDGLH